MKSNPCADKSYLLTKNGMKRNRKEKEGKEQEP